MLFRFYQVIRVLYYPFMMWVFPFLSKGIAGRLVFEKRNFQDHFCRSFKQDGIIADFAFEVSSEGELEQVKPVLERALAAGNNVELVFASGSVEKQCVSLADAHADQLRVLRLPLLTFFPGKSRQDASSWLSAKKLFLCRYDFFPSLLFYGSKKDVEFILLSGSLKSYERRSGSFLYKTIYSRIYKSFDKVVAATEVDKQRFLENFDFSENDVRAFDFRPLAISKRLDRREQTLGERFPGGQRLSSILAAYPKSNRLIFGSLWANELAAFDSDFDFKSYIVCIFPHRLDQESVEAIKKGLEARVKAPIYELRNSAEENLKTLESFELSPGPILVNLKGVLCESYPDFGCAFVGGGHGESVHSLMEPFMAGCMVLCGPRVHRSSEYDLIREKNPDRVRIVDRLENVFENFRQSVEGDLSSLNGFNDSYISGGKTLLSWLGISN